MIDMHTHLDLYPNALNIIDRVNKENIFTLNVTTSPRAWLATSEVFKKYSRIYVALGLHPEIVKSKSSEAKLLIDLIKRTRFIGEVGLDGSKEFEMTYDLQKKIFRDVLIECSRQGNKVLSIHSRNAVDDVLDYLEKYLDNCNVILHWFSGTKKQLERAISLGCWFSINPKMCKTKKGVGLIKQIPFDKILLESDGPFVTIENKTFYPWETKKIFFELSEILEVNESILEEKVNINLNKILK